MSQCPEGQAYEGSSVTPDCQHFRLFLYVSGWPCVLQHAKSEDTVWGGLSSSTVWVPGTDHRTGGQSCARWALSPVTAVDASHGVGAGTRARSSGRSVSAPNH